jgi:hypothetical protein
VLQDGHWTAEISLTGTDRWQPARVIPVADLSQAVELPAGTWDVRFRYAPWWLPPTSFIALAAWLGWTAWLGWAAGWSYGLHRSKILP